MNVIVVGCGRVGAELALSLHQDHLVAVIDPDPRAFDRLGLHFSGRTVQGEGLDRNTLIRAGIESADALASVTDSDNTNMIVARVAQDVFCVPRVAARVYNPRRLPLYEKLNLQAVASSSWGAHRLEQLLVHPALQSMVSTGNGEIQIYEITVPAAWAGSRLAELLPADTAIAVSLVRGNKASLPHANIVLKAEDVIQVSATTDGIKVLRERIPDNGAALHSHA